MNLAETLKNQQSQITKEDWRREKTLEYIKSQFLSGKRVVEMRFFGLYEDFPCNKEEMIPSEWKHICGGQHSKVLRDGNRYVGEKCGVSMFMPHCYSNKIDITDTEYPYKGFTDKEDRDAKIRILESEGFETLTRFIYGKGEVTFVALP